MNQDTNDQPQTAKPPRKRRAAKPRTPRQIDPAIKTIRDKAAEEVRQYHKAKASGCVLKRIIEKDLTRLTDQDQAYLLERLKEIVELQPIPK